MSEVTGNQLSHSATPELLQLLNSFPILVARNLDQQMPFVDDCRQCRQIANGGTFGHFASGIESRPVAFAVERVVVLGFQNAFPMGAIGGKGDQFIALADDEKAEVAEAFV